MSVTSGFFNSVLGADGKGDRTYDAEQLTSIFDGIITDGIIKNFGDAFAVRVNGGNEIVVGSGRAWFNHTWTLNDAALVFTLKPSDTSLGRIDAVVLEVNKSMDVRKNSIKIITGITANEPQRPELISTTDVKQYPLSYIRINAGSVEVSEVNIENMIGTDSCPYARPIVEDRDRELAGICLCGEVTFDEISGDKSFCLEFPKGVDYTLLRVLSVELSYGDGDYVIWPDTRYQITQPRDAIGAPPLVHIYFSEDSGVVYETYQYRVTFIQPVIEKGVLFSM